ncbi:MAG: hypothetical protein FWG67_00440 [Defluviitaleaceae bacterium]|nr:hypothetical protein [Defluviitaleaceae bacterium]
MREPFVYNEKGFLLLEHLISLVIIGMLSFAFLALMQVVSVYTVDQTALTMHEVNTLAVRLQNEIRSADFLTVSEGHLRAHFENDGNVVRFLAQHHRFMRQVNGRGGEILVYNISGADVFLFDHQSARLSLRSFDGDVFQFYLSTLSIGINEIHVLEIDNEGGRINDEE